MELSVKDICVNLDHKPIVKNVSLHVPEGKFVVLLGPNGSGKSTLLKSIYRTLQYQAGSVYLDIRYQLQVLAIVKRLGISCIAALHDLNLAAQFGDQIYCVRARS